MNKSNLFNLFLILFLSIDIINSTGVDHGIQKSPASVTYVDGPAPDELKAGPSNKKSTERRQNVKNVLQRYMVTTGAPTIETVFESSTIKSNIENMYDEVSTEKNLSNNKHNDSDNFATVEIYKKSSNDQNEQNHKNGHYMNHQFERYTNEEPNNSQKHTSYESEQGSQDFNPTYHEAMRSSVSIDFQTTTAHPVYRDPILLPGVHSTSLSNEYSTYNQNNKHDHNGYSGAAFSEEPAYSQQYHSSNANFNSESAYNNKPVHSAEGSSYNSHLETVNSQNLEKQTGGTSSMQYDYSLPSDYDFKQTYHIVNHQPTPNDQKSSDMNMQRFTYGERIPNPELHYLPQHESHPVYSNQPTVQHIPVVTEIPVTEVQEHHGVIQKTINVPQHGIQTKTYEVRRPAIQKQFYDIEERVVVKPAGSVVLEIDRPISKIPTGHVSTSFKENEDFGGYLPPHSDQSHPQQPNQPHQHQPEPNQAHPNQPQSNLSQPDQPFAHQSHRTQQHPHQPFPLQSHSNEQYSHQLQSVPHDGGNNGLIILTSGTNGNEHNQYLPPHYNPQNAAVRAGDHLIVSSSTNVATSECNNHSPLSHLHDAKTVPQYTVPIASAVTMTQTSTKVEDNPFVTNIKHSEKYIDSLKKHIPTQAPNLPANSENFVHVKNNRQPTNENLPMPQMITKGDPNFGTSPYVEVKSNGEPFAQQEALQQNYGANTLYTMQSVINNDLYNIRPNDESPINKVHSHPSQSSSHLGNYMEVNNKQQQNFPQSSPTNAHVEPFNANNFHITQNVPKNQTPQPFIVYAVTPNSNSNSNSVKSQPSSVTFSTSTVSTEMPFPSSTLSDDYNSNKPLHSHHFERLRSPAVHQMSPQTTQGHLNFIVSSTPRNAAFTQVYSPGIHLHYGPNSQNQENHDNVDAPVSHKTNEQQNVMQTRSRPSQNVIYSQEPGVTYHTVSSQALPHLNAHHIYMLHNNTQPMHIGQMLGALHALPVYYQGPPCDPKDPHNLPSTSTIPHPSANQYSNGNYHSDNSPQNINQESNAQFNGKTEFNRPQHLLSELPEKQNIKYLPPQHHVENNQPNNYKVPQHAVNHNEHVIYSGQENHQSPNYLPQTQHQPEINHLLPNKEKDNYQQNPPDSNIIYQSEHYQPHKIQPDTRPTGKRDQQHFLENNQNVHQMTNVHHNAPIYSNQGTDNLNQVFYNNRQPEIQYFPPNNKFQSNEQFQTMENSNGEHKQSTVSDNNSYNSAQQHNYPDRVDKTFQNKDSNTETLNLSEVKSSISTQTPVLQTVADSHHNDDSKPSHFQNEKSVNENNSEGNSNIQDSETSPTHSYYHVTNNIHPGDASISFHPLPSQSQSHILQYLLSSKGQAAQPVGPSSHSAKYSYGLEPIKARVVSAVPMSKNAKAAGEKTNTRRIVVNQPIETVQVVEEQQPITQYKQITVQEPTVYKTQTVGVKKVETSIPVLVHQLPIYPSMPVYHDHHHSYSHNHGRGHVHFQSPIYLENGVPMPAAPVYENHNSGDYKMDSHVIRSQDSAHVLPDTHSTTAHPKITLDLY